MRKLDYNQQADRQIMADLMANMKLIDRKTCTHCGLEGIILQAVNSDVEACWVCVKNGVVVNPTGLGFCPPDLGKYLDKKM